MANIDIKLKSYDQLIFEIAKLNTDKYLLQQENKQLKETLKDIEELLLSEEQPVQPCNIRYDILEIINKALGDKE